MTAGIPGAGIGGIFYLANALWLPFRGLLRRQRGEPVPWRSLLPQSVMALGILLGIWSAGWLLGLWLPPASHPAAPLGPLSSAAARTARLLGAATIFASLATLVAVLLSVQLARVLVRPPHRPSHPGQPR